MYELGWNNGQVKSADGTPLYNLLYKGTIIGGLASKKHAEEIVNALNMYEAKKRSAEQETQDMQARENWFVYSAYGVGAATVTQIPKGRIPELLKMGAIAPIPAKPVGHYVAINGFTIDEIERLTRES